MNRYFLLFPLVLLAASQGWAQNLELYLDLDAYGQDTYAVWKVGEGLRDSKGSANFGLEFEKEVPQATPAAAFARVQNVYGRPLSFLTEGTGLFWERRNDGDCGWSPRWNIQVKGKSGSMYWIQLVCRRARHSAGSSEGWTRDSFYAADIVTFVVNNFGSSAADVLEGSILQLYIPFNLGNDVGHGFVYLDNIQVNERIWTGPQDNYRR